MFCYNCGNRLEDNMRFCPICGTRSIVENVLISKQAEVKHEGFDVSSLIEEFDDPAMETK